MPPFEVGTVLSFEENFLKQVTQAYYILDSDEIDHLSTALSVLMTRQFSIELNKIITTSPKEQVKRADILVVPHLNDVEPKGLFMWSLRSPILTS